MMLSSKPTISVCIPARNEERFIGACLTSIRNAEAQLSKPVEIVVVLNRCTDRTEEIAKSFGARIIHEDAKNLSIIRNAGVRAASAPMVATIDADSRMSPNMLVEIFKRLDSGQWLGGGVAIVPDRLSVGIVITAAVILALTLPFGLSGGLFWFRREDFEKIGGFDESLLTAEDVDFAYRLRRLAKKERRHFSTILRAHIVSSARKFDEFGDWYLLNPKLLWRLAQGRNRADADRFWYEVNR